MWVHVTRTMGLASFLLTLSSCNDDKGDTARECPSREGEECDHPEGFYECDQCSRMYSCHLYQGHYEWSETWGLPCSCIQEDGSIWYDENGDPCGVRDYGERE